MFLRLTVVLLLCTYIGVHCTDTDAAPVSDGVSAEEVTSNTDEGLGDDVRAAVDNQPSEQVQEDGTEQRVNPPVEEGGTLEEEGSTQEEEAVNEEATAVEEESQDVPAAEEERTQEEAADQQEDHTDQEEPILTEEDKVQACIVREIDCNFHQPLTLAAFEASITAGKSAADVCRGLRDGEKCLKELLQSDCKAFLVDNNELKLEKEAPVIKHLCDETIQEVDENWNCLRTGLTEANLNTCSQFDDRSTCDVNEYVKCLVEEFGEVCSEDAKKLFGHIYKQMARLQREDCRDEHGKHDDHHETTTESGGFFNFFN